MLFLISLAAGVIFVLALKKPLKKYPYIFYIMAVIITALISCVDLRNLSGPFKTAVEMFSRGTFSTALWCIVMWTGAFKNGSKPIKTLMPIRGELSIFAAILTLGHNIGYGKTYFVRLFTDADRMPQSQITAAVMTIILMFIMIPLTIMSFPGVRKKMKASLWKKIQRTAYAFYALIYIHVLSLFIPMAQAGRDGYLLSIVAYSTVFIGYAVCRIRKSYLAKCSRSKKNVNGLLVNTACFSAFAICVVLSGIYAKPEKVKVASTNKKSESNVTLNITTTTFLENAKQNIQKTEITSVLPSKTEQTTTSVSESMTTSDTTVTDTEQTSSEEQTQIQEETAEEPVHEETPPAEEPQTEPAEVTEEIVTEPEITEPKIIYIYNNGTYTASAYGYDGDVEVTITIENDVITSIDGQTFESDAWYFDSAKDHVFSQILSSQNTDVDAYGGCTYSSDAIMEAVRKALESARK